MSAFLVNNANMHYVPDALVHRWRYVYLSYGDLRGQLGKCVRIGNLAEEFWAAAEVREIRRLCEH